MKVYVLSESDYDTFRILGVFSSKEKAEKSKDSYVIDLKMAGKIMMPLDIEEHEIK